MRTIPKNEALILDKIIGNDLKLPIEGKFEPIKGMDLLLQDIQQLLLTLPGERVSRPEYGCTLRNQIWENIDEAEQEGQDSIRQAIEDFEPRITLLSINSEKNYNTGLITFYIEFIVNGTDTSANLVFPLRVGTALSFK